MQNLKSNRLRYLSAGKNQFLQRQQPCRLRLSWTAVKIVDFWENSDANQTTRGVDPDDLFIHIWRVLTPQRWLAVWAEPDGSA